MKVQAESITIQMTANEAYMLCLVLKDVNWKEFSSDVSVTEGYIDLVNEFINKICKEIR